ncbi:MAG: cadherin-like beta sandwich domain-containing protein [Deltaproteobacteria bacterium]
MKIKNRLLSLLISLALILGMVLVPDGRPAQADVVTYRTGGDPITISDAGDYLIYDDSPIPSYKAHITVNGGLGAVNIVLRDVLIRDATAGLSIGTGTTVNLTLQGQNILYGSPALHVPEGAALIITDISTGSLMAFCEGPTSGIGGGASHESTGNVTINGGSVTATGGECSAGIGNSQGGSGGTVNINGGMVMATGGWNGSGIGSAAGDSGCTVTINGGTVTAQSSVGGAGIAGSTVTINGGTVMAQGGVGGAGIAGGSAGSGGTVTINDGIVTAAGGIRGSGIGGGQGGNGGTVTVNGGSVKAIGGPDDSGIGRPDAFGIGGGVDASNQGTATIDGGSVKVNSMGPAVYNSSSVQVYPVTISGLPADSDASYTRSGASPRFCITDAEGKLYLWLPATEAGSSTDIMIMVSKGRYIASGTISATESNSLSAHETMISTTGLPAGTIGVPYTADLSVHLPASAPYTWSADGLPAGLTISTENNNGIISGTPADTGDYEVTVTVKDAYDITDSATFILTIAQTAAIDLASLTVSEGTLNPAFDKNLVTYNLDNAPADISSLGITATTSEEAGADAPTLKINQEIAQSGILHNVNLNQGTNLIPIEVTSPDDLSQKCYVISVNGKVSNADLDELAIDGQVFDPVFAPDNLNYSLNVDNSIDSIMLTASPEDSKALMLLNGGLLPDGTETTVELPVGPTTLQLMVVAQDASTKTYTVKINRQEVFSITSNDLPAAVLNQPYSYTLEAAGGSGTYTWSSADLMGWLSLSETGVLTGTPIATGSCSFTVDLTSGGATVSKDLTLEIRNGTGNGAYLVVPVADASYQAGLTTDNLPTMKINPGFSGFRYFSVAITPVSGHAGDETMVFVHKRKGRQLSVQASRGDYDVLTAANCGFNVLAGDVIQVYVVDSLTNDPAVNPVIL